jgi:hypothetical protein
MKRSLEQKNNDFKDTYHPKLRNMNYHPIILKAFDKLPLESNDHKQAVWGMNRAEPLLELFNSILQYMQAYQKAYNAKIATDGVLGSSTLQILEGIKELLNGQGGTAMLYGNTTDSKANGMMYDIYQEALILGGYPDAT